MCVCVCEAFPIPFSLGKTHFLVDERVDEHMTYLVNFPQRNPVYYKSMFPTIFKTEENAKTSLISMAVKLEITFTFILL